MTDIMKLADDYARSYMSFGEPAARSALQSAIEALQGENERLKRQLDAGKDVWRQDQARIAELQAKLDAAPKALEPVAYSVGNTLKWHEGKGMTNAQLFAAPKALEPIPEPERKKMWHGTFEAHSRWSAYEWFSHGIQRAEAAHGITKGTPT